jgi:hypothetical protein
MSLTINLVKDMLEDKSLITDLTTKVVDFAGIHKVGEHEYTIIDNKLINIQRKEVAIIIQEEKGFGWVNQYKHISNAPETFVFSPLLALDYIKYQARHKDASIQDFIYSHEEPDKAIIKYFNLSSMFGPWVSFGGLTTIMRLIIFLELKWVQIGARFNITRTGSGESIELFKSTIPISQVKIFHRKKITIHNTTYFIVNDYFVFNNNMTQIAYLYTPIPFFTRPTADKNLFCKMNIMFILENPDRDTSVQSKPVVNWLPVGEDCMLYNDVTGGRSIVSESKFMYSTKF